MRTMILMAVLILGATTACAQEEPQVDCANDTTQMALNICAQQDYEKADQELNVVYKQAIKSQADIDKFAAEMGPDYVGAVKALKKAQRAWIDYRDGHCEGMGFAGVGGSIRPLLVSGCLASLTTNRTKELRELIQGLGGN